MQIYRTGVGSIAVDRDCISAAGNEQSKAPDDAPCVLLAHVDGIGDGQIVCDAVSPIVIIALLGRQSVVEGGQPRALKSCACEDPVTQNQAGRSCKASQRVTCNAYSGVALLALTAARRRMLRTCLQTIIVSSTLTLLYQP